MVELRLDGNAFDVPPPRGFGAAWHSVRIVTMANNNGDAPTSTGTSPRAVYSDTQVPLWRRVR